MLLGVLVQNTQRPLCRRVAQLRHFKLICEAEDKQLRPQTRQPLLEEVDLQLTERAGDRVHQIRRSGPGARSAVAGGLARLAGTMKADSGGCVGHYTRAKSNTSGSKLQADNASVWHLR